MHYLLTYQLVDDYLARRDQFREAHIRLAWQAVECGELLLGGPLANPTDTAILLFQGDSPAAAEAFVNADPYVKNGLVKRWKIREWTTVVGSACTNPVRL